MVSAAARWWCGCLSGGLACQKSTVAALTHYRTCTPCSVQCSRLALASALSSTAKLVSGHTYALYLLSNRYGCVVVRYRLCIYKKSKNIFSCCMKCQSCLLANVIDVAGKRRFGDESHHLESIFDKNHRALIGIALVIYHLFRNSIDSLKKRWHTLEVHTQARRQTSSGQAHQDNQGGIEICNEWLTRLTLI